MPEDLCRMCFALASCSSLVARRRAGRCGAAITIKLATLAPVNSSWHKALLDMGAEWEAKTGGRVKLTVYADGTQGSEDATIRMMRPGVDQLQANLLMLPGPVAHRRRLQRVRHAVLLPVGRGRAVRPREADARCSRSGSTPKASSCSPGAAPGGSSCSRRSRSATLDRREDRQAVHQPGRRPHGAVVQGQRLPSRRPRGQRHPGAAEAQRA